MATSYKTPGVYIEEIAKFPPSVAEVETAIPAFVGYTEKAKRFVPNDLIKVPTRIKSLLDFEMYFGYGPSYTDIHVQLNNSNLVDEVTTTVSNTKYSLYESMRLFYDNGGGACYIVCAGLYENNHNDADRATNLTAALAELNKFDEPTILLFPDAVQLKNGTEVNYDAIAGLQQAALMQCGNLGDRFAVLDVPESSTTTIEESVELFRTKVGMNNLKYGAAYTPFLKTNYTKTFRLSTIAANFFNSSAASIKLKSLFTDSDKDSNGNLIKNKLDDFEKTYTDNAAISKRLAIFSGQAGTEPFSSNHLDSQYQTLVQNFNAAGTDAARKGALKAAFEYVFYLFAQLEGLVIAHAPADIDATDTPGPNAAKPIRTTLVTNAGLLSSMQSLLATNLKTNLQSFASLTAECYNPGNDISAVAGDQPGFAFTFFTSTAWSPVTPVAQDKINAADPLAAKCAAALSELSKVYDAAKAGINSVVSNGLSYEQASESALLPDLPIYNSIVTVLNKKVNTLPPSAAIAGIYATVDRERGVWKAPANVSINSVTDVSQLIDDRTQDGLNVDSNAGKSVNAIRSFYGRGILVWGARTMAGNDNEWRYVPVRRLFNFAEESSKKSTSWCVFEPNDANTWAKIRGQLDNFMTNLWRNGALAGAKPEHAFYVNCGLGVTMTAQDILEGRLIVEIGMAAVRPAEFVILKFSHKLQES